MSLFLPPLHAFIPIRCVVYSVVTLLLQSDGEEAITALHGVCPPKCALLMHKEGMENED